MAQAMTWLTRPNRISDAQRGVSALAIVLATLAIQPAAAQNAVQPAPAQDTTTAAAQGGTEETGIGDIVVTAQRRSESAQRAAIALTTLSAESLTEASVTQPTQLATVVPAIKITPTGGANVNVYLRGVGTQAANVFAENAIAVNLDGVYLGRPAALSGLLYDLERVEVLKGPQGTLYGRNATGGAINLVTRMPRLGEVSGEIGAEYGNYDTKKLRAAISLPLGSMAAIRIAGQYADRDGYLSDGYDDENTKSIRANLLVEPSAAVRILLSADYEKLGGKGPGAVLAPANSSDTVTPSLQDRVGGSDPVSIAALSTRFPGLVGTVLNTPQQDGYVDSESYGFAGNVSVDTGAGTVTFIPAYRVTKPNFLGYSTGFSALVQETAKQTSTELRYASPEDKSVRVQVGGYYFHQTQDFLNLFIVANPVGTNVNGRLGLDSYAAFGQGTLDLTSTLRLVGGIRYTSEKKSRVGVVGPQSFTGPTGPFAPFDQSKRFNATTWRAGFEFDAAPRSLLYGNVATGFKSGGFYTGSGDASFRPEHLTAYTLGSKNRFFDNRLQLNLEAFYWDYKDQQVGYIGPVLVNGVYVAGGLTNNVGQARMYGLDTEMRLLVGHGGNLSANLQYLNAKYTSFRFAALSGNGAALLTSCSSTADPSFPTTAPGRVFQLDCSGKPAINAPKWSATISYEHAIDVGGDFRLVPQVSTKIESGRFLAIEYLPTEYQPGYMKSNASLALRKADQWSLTAFVNNLEDKTTRNFAILRPVVPATYVGLDAPRTYGIRAEYKF